MNTKDHLLEDVLANDKRLELHVVLVRALFTLTHLGASDEYTEFSLAEPISWISKYRRKHELAMVTLLDCEELQSELKNDKDGPLAISQVHSEDDAISSALQRYYDESHFIDYAKVAHRLNNHFSAPIHRLVFVPPPNFFNFDVIGKRMLGIFFSHYGNMANTINVSWSKPRSLHDFLRQWSVQGNTLGDLISLAIACATNLHEQRVDVSLAKTMCFVGNLCQDSNLTSVIDNTYSCRITYDEKRNVHTISTSLELSNVLSLQNTSRSLANQSLQDFCDYYKDDFMDIPPNINDYKCVDSVDIDLTRCLPCKDGAIYFVESWPTYSSGRYIYCFISTMYDCLRQLIRKHWSDDLSRSKSKKVKG